MAPSGTSLNIPYSDPRNSEIAMDCAPDRYRYVLERPLIEPPGTRWIYNGGATALLARIIAKGTGKPLQDYAQEVLFDPLEISRTEWARGADGEAIAASGLRMTARDLTKIGIIAQSGGHWNGHPIVPADWLSASFQRAVSMPDGRSYGYHWYVGAVPRDDGTGGIRWEKAISAIGNGGQRLVLLPQLDLIVTITAGNYDSPDHWRPPMIVLRDIILPSLH